jgi:peptidoglycan-N-acetylglucosamine deacetylase
MDDQAAESPGLTGAAGVRSKPSWLGGGSATAVLTFALDGETPVLAAGRRYASHAMTMTHQAFEAQVGLPRLLKLLKEYRLPATFFVPGFTAERWPAMVEAVLAAGHEVAHHSYSHRPPSQLSEADDRAEFERGLEALAVHGVVPSGYRAPMWSATWRTAEFVREYGMLYDSSLMDDDRPYILSTGKGEVVEIPPHWSLDDWEQYAYLPEPHLGYQINSPTDVADMWVRELDAMRRHQTLFVLTNHAFLSGRAGRVEGLRHLIEQALDRGDVTFRTANDVATEVISDPASQRRTHTPLNVDPSLYPTW